MLHHIPSADLQDTALAEMARVLRPGGLIVGSDGLDTPDRRGSPQRCPARHERRAGHLC